MSRGSPSTLEVKSSPDSHRSAEAIANLKPAADLPVICRGASGLDAPGRLISGWASHLDAFSAYPLPTQLPSICAVAAQLVHRRSVRPGPLVLRTTPFNLPTLIPDMDRTVSRRSEPSSRTALMGEQPNPWDVLPPQVATSRHRGAKPPRRCGLLGEISLLSPG